MKKVALKKKNKITTAELVKISELLKYGALAVASYTPLFCIVRSAETLLTDMNLKKFLTLCAGLIAVLMLNISIKKIRNIAENINANDDNKVIAVFIIIGMVLILMAVAVVKPAVSALYFVIKSLMSFM